LKSSQEAVPDAPADLLRFFPKALEFQRVQGRHIDSKKLMLVLVTSLCVFFPQKLAESGISINPIDY
jgi:hypothetical protein